MTSLHMKPREWGDEGNWLPAIPLLEHDVKKAKREAPHICPYLTTLVGEPEVAQIETSHRQKERAINLYTNLPEKICTMPGLENHCFPRHAQHWGSTKFPKR